MPKKVNGECLVEKFVESMLNIFWPDEKFIFFMDKSMMRFLHWAKKEKNQYFFHFLPGRLDKSNHICLVHLTSFLMSS